MQRSGGQTVRRPAVSGQWSAVSGQRSAVSGQRSSGQRSAISGQRTGGRLLSIGFAVLASVVWSMPLISSFSFNKHEQFVDNYASGSVLVDQRHDNTPHNTTQTSNLYLVWVEVHLEKAVTYVMKDQLCCPRLSTQHTQGLFTSSRGLNKNRIPCWTSEVKWG